jgi:tRNA A37 threonylcarbamoyladenosine biosynthesis protein TsaE
MVLYELAMPETDICSRSPDLMQYLESGNLVFFGAADIGKSTVVNETDDVQQIERLADLSDPVAEYVALDDIYCLYQEYRSSTNDELREQFEELIARDYGVCLVTRPRSLDWLFTHTDFTDVAEITEFTFLARQFDEGEAIETAAGLASDLSEEEIQANIDRLEYVYTFEDDSLEDYSTFVPFIVLRSSVLGESGGIFPGDLLDLSEDGVLTSLRGFAGRFSESIGFSNITIPSSDEFSAVGSDALEFLQDYDQVYKDTIQPFLEQNQESIQAATASIASGIGASAAPIVGPLLIGALLRPDGTAQSRDATADFFGELLDDELLPPSRCALEEEMGVPPMTLEYLRTITRPEFHSQLTQLLEADIDYLETIATQTQAEVEELQDDLDQLSDRVTVIEEFISARTQDAVTSQETLRAELEALERQYLQVSGSISIEDIELQNVDLEQRYRDILTGSRIQVLRGPHGTGKTTLSYRLCQQFAADEYTVRIPQFNQESRSFVKTALEAVQGPLVVFTSYRVGAFAVDDASQISFLLELVDDGIIDKLLIECRDEVYGQLNDEMQSRTANERVESRKDELWRFRGVFELPEIDEDGIQAIVTWVGDIKGDQETVQQQLSSIVDIAGQNPEVAKIAARMVCDGQDLTHIQTEDELIWHDIQNLTSARSDQIETAQRRIVKWLAATGGLPEDELEQLTDISRGVFAEALDNLSRYWQTTENGTFRLIPDVYQEIIFREECLEQLNRYVPVLAKEGYGSYLSNVALNITICANVPHREQYPRLEQKCLDGAEITLSTILETDDTDQLYYQSMETLSTTDLPLPLATIQANELVQGIVEQVDAEANNAYQQGKKVHTTERPEDSSLDILSRIAANHTLAAEYDEVDDLVGVMVEAFRLHQESSPDASWMLQYWGETVYEYEIQYVMECIGSSFERVASHRDIDGLVADSEAILDIILEYEEGDLRVPDRGLPEGPHTLQTTVFYYSQVIAGVAHVENERTNISSLLSIIHDHLGRKFDDIDSEGLSLQIFSVEEWLIQGYALFIKSLLYHHEFDLVDNWPDVIEVHVNDTFEPEDQCQFYKYIVEWAATRAEMEPRPGWLIWILSHEGILSIATDDDLHFIRFKNEHELMKSFQAACLGVNKSINLPKESAKLHNLLEARTDELEGNYARIHQAVVEELGTIDELFHR